MKFSSLPIVAFQPGFVDCLLILEVSSALLVKPLSLGTISIELPGCAQLSHLMAALTKGLETASPHSPNAITSVKQQVKCVLLCKEGTPLLSIECEVSCERVQKICSSILAN